MTKPTLKSEQERNKILNDKWLARDTPKTYPGTSKKHPWRTATPQGKSKDSLDRLM